MKILLTNDDGIFAPGLAAIYHELLKLGDVAVVAPANGQSGASHSITFAEPLACNKVNITGRLAGYSVSGSPADCVKLAVMALYEKPFDLVVSGINQGANTGINIYYSGTVAAAMEAAFLDIPSVAMSLASEPDMDFAQAADYCVKVLKKVLPLKKGEVINVNVPRLSQGPPKGIKVVPQSTKGFEERYIHQVDEHDQIVFQLAGGNHRSEDAPSDTISLVNGYITVTALAAGMTDDRKTRQLQEVDWDQ